MPDRTLVRDVMTTAVAVLAPDTPVGEVAQEMSARAVGAMPVVDSHGRLLGLLRDEDLIVSEARVHVPTMINVFGLATIPLPGEMERLESEIRKVAGSTAADVMDPDPPTIGPEDTLEDLATSMHERDVTHLPVVEDGRLVGIVARGDLVRFIARIP